MTEPKTFTTSEHAEIAQAGEIPIPGTLRDSGPQESDNVENVGIVFPDNVIQHELFVRPRGYHYMLILACDKCGWTSEDLGYAASLAAIEDATVQHDLANNVRVVTEYVAGPMGPMGPMGRLSDDDVRAINNVSIGLVSLQNQVIENDAQIRKQANEDRVALSLRLSALENR